MPKMKCMHFGSYWMGKNDIVYAMAADLKSLCDATIIDVDIYSGKKSGWYEEDFSGNKTYPIRWLSHEKVVAEVEKRKPNFLVCNAGGLSITPQTAAYLKKRHIKTIGIGLSDPDVFNDQTGKIYTLFDVFFTNSKLAHDTLYEQGRVFLLPFAASTNIHKPMNLKKKYDVVVVGHARPERLKLVAKLREKFTVGTFGNGWGEAWKAVNGEEQIKAINSGRMYLSFALTLAGFTNVKVGLFEAAACRSCIAVQFFPEMEQYFQYGTEILGYTDDASLIALLTDFTNDKRRREWIADNSYARFLAEHTWKHRWQFMLDSLKEAA